MRIWGRIIKDNRLIKDHVYENYDIDLRRTQKVYAALDEFCNIFDLAVPIWLESNQKDFLCHSRTRFTADSFMEPIDFDFLDFYVIEEDL